MKLFANHTKFLPIQRLLRSQLVLTLAGLKFTLAAYQNPPTNQKLFTNFFLFLIGWISCSYQIPMVKGEALGVLGRRQGSHFPHPKATGEIRQCWYDKIAPLAGFLINLGLLPPMETCK
jgi:hypothetical protein